VTTRLVLRKLTSNDEGAFVRATALTAVSDPEFAKYYRPAEVDACLLLLERSLVLIRALTTATRSRS
jgi:hypothetical protein